MRTAEMPVIGSAHAGECARRCAASASKPSVCRSMNARSCRLSRTTTCIMARASAASVPGLSTKTSSDWAAASVSRTSIVTTCAPRHLAAARRRGAHVVTIDVRETEAAAQSDEVFVLKPGTDAALALAMMHVVVRDNLHDRAFIERHTLGFDALAAHLRAHSPAWAEPITGISAVRIEALARRYAATRPAMIVIGGSSMYK